METGLTKKQKVTELYYNAKDPTAEIYTHDTSLKKRLRKYADQHPNLCRITDDDGHGGLRFEIDKHRISIRLTAPYTDARRKAASELAKKQGVIVRSVVAPLKKYYTIIRDWECPNLGLLYKNPSDTRRVQCMNPYTIN